MGLGNMKQLDVECGIYCSDTFSIGEISKNSILALLQNVIQTTKHSVT